jgi:glycosyltransferase involved in cell wall biosynthesis
MVIRLAIVVPEYFTERSLGGGLASFGDFLVATIGSKPGWSADIVSPRMWNAAPESRRVLDPKTWIRGVTTSVRTVGDVEVTYVGANWSEFEFMRYAPRKELDDVLNKYDAVIGVFGTPAQCLMFRSLRVPAIAKVATLVALERRQLLSSLTGLRWLLAKANLYVTARLDEKGLFVPTRLMVINDWMFKYCQKRVGSKVELAPPGVDTDFYVPLKDDSASHSAGDSTSLDPSPYFLFVGRLADPRKDIKSLLRAYRLACDTFDVPQKLILAGRGDIQPDEYQLIAELGLEERVEIIPDVPRDALRALYQGADLFVLSSAEEGLGIVLLEAMSCGTPVLSSATEGARYAMGDGEVGSLIDLGPRFVEELAVSLGRWATDPAARKRAGLNGRRRVVENFSYQAMSQKYVDAVSTQRGHTSIDGE